VYESIFRDATYALPTLGVEFQRDLARLLRLLSCRGYHLFGVDLPAVGKHFDRCLANGEYKISGLPLTKGYHGGGVIPKFLRGLYLLIFEKTGSLKRQPSTEAIFFVRQICYAAKKAEVPCKQEKVEQEIVDFYLADQELPDEGSFWQATTPTEEDIYAEFKPFAKTWHYVSRIAEVVGDDAERRSSLGLFLGTLDRVSRVLSAALGRYSPDDWRFRHGPGAVSERTGPVNKYNFVNWSDRLENVFPCADYGYHCYTAWANDVETMRFAGSEEPAARLIAVPKSYSKPRLIAAEPSEHQWCQQNIWHFLRTRSTNSWVGGFVRFNDQTLNQTLCRKGSEDGSLSTVDLSAASDRVTCLVVGTLFRRNPDLLLALQATRTRVMSQTLTTKVPERFMLRKFSTMGNACTFPVESLVFLSITLAAVLTKRGIRANEGSIRALMGEVAVFGDDIVVPSDSRELLFDALRLLDFKVNIDKSFWTGKFRESCGVDSYDGHDVTPAYWKAPYSGKPESVAMTVDVANNFYKKWLLNASSYIASTVRKALPIVAIDSGVCGLKSRVSGDYRSLKDRWNTSFQRMESLVPLLTAKVKKTPIADDSALLQYFTESPGPYNMWRSGFAQRPVLRLKYGWVPTESLITQ